MLESSVRIVGLPLCLLTLAFGRAARVKSIIGKQEMMMTTTASMEGRLYVPTRGVYANICDRKSQM